MPPGLVIRLAPLAPMGLGKSDLRLPEPSMPRPYPKKALKS